MKTVSSPSKLKHARQRLGQLALLLPLLFLLSFSLGHYPIAPLTVLELIGQRLNPWASAPWETEAALVLFNIRLPRLLLAMAVGAGLACAGAVFQSVFQNPLVSPAVLGTSAASACGAALGILLGFSAGGITLTAFVSGLISIFLVFLLASRLRLERQLSLVLCGLIVGSLGSALLSLLKLMADPQGQLPAITYWLMGSLASANRQSVRFALPLLLAGMIILLILRWQLNLLTLGVEQARALGVNVHLLRTLFLITASLLTAASVAVSGMIGWIGLVVPHMATLLLGADYRYSLPGCALIGASFTLAVDQAARLLADSEIPLGILTAVIGAPLFLYLLLREKEVQA